MKVPGPDHPISIAATGARVTVTFNGHVVADTVEALSLTEAGYPVVHYIARGDVDMRVLRRTGHATHCPYKGDAAYWTIDVDGRTAENAVWSYEAPFPAVAEIGDRLAFYAGKVDDITVTPG